MDCGAVLDGWAADAAVSLCVGAPRPADQRLIRTARAALDAGIAVAAVGARIGDISAAIGRAGRSAGHGINTDYGGHGVGRSMHEDPSVPNEGRPGRGLRLRAGMALAVERGSWPVAAMPTASTRTAGRLRTADGSRAAHVEHTVAVTDDGPWVLTAA